MSADQTDEQTSAPGLNRRGLIARLGAGGLGVAALATAGVVGSASPAQAESFDKEIMNFALNFEYLGAELYLHALYGSGLSETDTSGVGTKGTVSAGGPVPFTTAAYKSIIEKFAVDEVGHVRFLRSQLGALAIAEPTINLSSSWTVLALAAGVISPGETFDPFADEVSLLIGAYVLEDVCVTALVGAAGVLTNKNDVSAVAGLLGTEAAQAGTLRTLLAMLNKGGVTDKISALRAKLSDANDDFGTAAQGSTYNIVSNNADGLVFARSPLQVLNIAYGGGAASDFGFFPDRVNGVIS